MQRMFCCLRSFSFLSFCLRVCESMCVGVYFRVCVDLVSTLVYI